MLDIALAIESANITEENISDDEQLFFSVTCLTSLILLINGTMTEYVVVKLEAMAGEGSPADAGPVHHLQRLRLCGAQEAVQVMVNGGERTNAEEAAQCEPG